MSEIGATEIGMVESSALQIRFAEIGAIGARMHKIRAGEIGGLKIGRRQRGEAEARPPGGAPISD